MGSMLGLLIPISIAITVLCMYIGKHVKGIVYDSGSERFAFTACAIIPGANCLCLLICMIMMLSNYLKKDDNKINS